MAEFTSWAELRQKLLDDLAGADFMTSSYTIGGRTRTCRTLREVREFLEFVNMMVQAESGGSAGVAFAQFRRPGVGR